MNKQIRQVGAVLVVLFFVLFLQLNNTQVLRADSLAQNPLNTRNAVRDFSAPRGVIQTADGVVIANSVPTDDQYEQLRQYPEGELFGHITGFFSFTFGNEGLERTYNDDLTGRTYALKNIGDLLTDRVRTNNVTISITKKMQETARDQLQGRRGSVVAIDPQTGAVLAMYSNPSYDPTPLASHDFEAVTAARTALIEDETNPLLPRTYRESFPPGSTQKVVTASAAYDRQPNLTTRRYPTMVTMSLPQSDRTLRNFGGSRCGGTVADLLRVSCNTGFAQMGIDLGAENLAAESEDFGYNQEPPIDLPAPAASSYPTAEEMSRNAPMRAYSAIGQQNVSATPLQMALVAAGIANDGVIMAPTVMSEIRDNRGDIVERAEPERWKQATSPETAEQVKALMVDVASRGTATNARIPGVEVGAKTGTAEIGNGNVHTWLISFAPANDPKIAVAVIVENQPGFDDSTGGRIAAPIAQTMMRTHLGL